jgi:hypothetical protein
MVDLIHLHLEKDMDARRLDIRIHDADPVPFSGDGDSEVRCNIRFARSASEAVNRNDLPHFSSPWLDLFFDPRL